MQRNNFGSNSLSMSKGGWQRPVVAKLPVRNAENSPTNNQPDSSTKDS